MTRHLTLLAVSVLVTAFAQPSYGAFGGNRDVIDGNWTVDTVPRDDSAPFPLDASPWIRVGNGPTDMMQGETEAALFHLPLDGEPVRLTVELDSEDHGMPGGFVSWIRLHPDALLVEGERYQLRFIQAGDAETPPDVQERMDNLFVPVEFIAGPTDDTSPRAPDHSVRVLDNGLQGGSVFQEPSHIHSTRVDVIVADADFAPHDTWLFFMVLEDFDGDVSDLRPERWTSPGFLTADQVEVAAWSYIHRGGDGRQCVVSVTEDVYGATDESAPVCADPVNAACDGCSSAGPTRGGLLAILSMVFVLGTRRRRL